MTWPFKRNDDYKCSMYFESAMKSPSEMEAYKSD
jgi:hypothetical protein